jgi:hypothetical protein
VLELEGRALLANLTVSSIADDGSPNTLRWAINQANASSEADTISFSALFDTPQTITLTGGALALNGTATTTIQGPGANLLAVSGGGKSGVFAVDSAPALISGLTITGGSAGVGGGVRNDGGNVTLSNVAVRGNAATGQGGGVATRSGGTTNLVASLVSGNTAASGGGGLLNQGGTLSLTNSTVTGNTAATGSGGGLASSAGMTTLINVTVTANTAGTAGGVGVAGGSATLTNTIVAANTGGDVSGNYTADHSLIGVDPKLSPLGDYGGPTQTMAPLPGSPAIGGGATGTGIPKTDQRGQSRAGSVDIGAFQTQGVIVVNITADGVGSGAGQISLRQAVNLADVLTSADTIGFDPTIFAASRTITLTDGTLALTDKATTTINGPGATLLTVDGRNATPVFQIGGGSAAVSGITVSGGGGNAALGGGFGNYGGTLSLTGCTVSGNSANAGAGLFSQGGNTTLTGCTISGNTAALGGGLYCESGTLSLTDCNISGNGGDGAGLRTKNGTTTLTNCTISGNSSNDSGGGVCNLRGTTSLTKCIVTNNSSNGFGAGLYTYYGTLKLTDCTVSGNTDTGYGGGLGNERGSLILIGCTVSGNTAQFGAGVFSRDAGNSTTLTNSTVSGNTASQQGGGLYGASGATMLINCTVSGNSAPTGSGLINVNNSATVTLTNTIVAGNSKDDISGNYTGDHNLIGGNPLLSPPGDFGGPTMTMVPLPGSLAIGGGTTGNGVPTIDQRGQPRSSRIDIGAFQGGGTTLVVNSTTDGVGSGSGQISLRQAINLANAQPTAETIDFAPSVFQTPQTITLAGTELLLADTKGATTITAPAAGLTVNGGGKSRVFEINSGVTASISGLAITGGRAYSGAGVHNLGGTLSMNDCTISGNTSTSGGGGLGGVGTLTLLDCTFSGNTSLADGGGLNIYGGTASLTSVTVSGNTSTADDGGGVAVFDCAVTLINCTVSGNTSAKDGGGLFNVYHTTSLTLINCTVSGNSTSGSGGGIRNEGGLTTLTNTIVAGQTGGGDIVGALVSSSSNNLVGDGTGMTGISDGNQGNQVGTSQAPINPLLSPLGNYGGPTPTLGLLPGTPALGGGASGTGVPATDQRGQPRAGRVDIGAFQSQGFTLMTVASSDFQLAVIGQSFANPLAVAVTANNPVEPVNGGFVSFAAPGAGGSTATLSAATATITGGQASVTATANNIPGQFTVSASAIGAGSSVSIFLTNTEVPSLLVNTVQDVINTIDGTTSLREAINYSLTLANPSTITFSSAVFGKTPQTIVLALGTLSLTNLATTTIVGPGANLLTVSGAGTFRVFDISGPAVLSGLTISQGQADNGAGIRNYRSALALTDCTISDNGTLSLLGPAHGGGLYAVEGTTSLTNCTVTGNSAVLNGGGLAAAGGTIALTGSTISANKIGFSGGGLSVDGATATLTGCTVSGNSSLGTGGGLFVSPEGKLTVANSILIGNTAEANGAAGGGLASSSGTATITNCTITGNSATGRGSGGGLAVSGGTTSVINCTITGNSAPAGGGLYTTSQAATLINTIVAGQKSGGDVAGNYNDDGGNLISGSPLLAPLGDYGGPTPTMALLSGSPAIGGGTTGTGVPSTDQRGVLRGASIDIGAFQTQGTSVVVNSTADGVGSAFGQVSLRQAVNIVNAQTTGDSITFDPSVFATPETITLTSDPLVLTDLAKTTIAGPGANLLTISGGDKTRVFDVPGSSLALSGLTISGGNADNGGGLRNNAGTLALTNVTVSGNTASGNGGGLYTTSGSSTTLEDVTFNANTASVGGGVAIGQSSASTLTNVTVSGNTATSNGGGLAVLGGTLSLTNVTISNNRAGGTSGSAGGGLDISGATANVRLRNTIVAGNGNNDVSGSYTGTKNLIGGNQLLAPLGNYGGPTQTIALLPGSPAIAGGSAGFGVPATDQRGQPRDGHVDIGAFQSQGFTLNPVAGSTPQTASGGQAFTNPLAVAVTPSNPVEPVVGGVVSFAAPPSGASATLSAGTATIIGGQAGVAATARVTATASNTPGQYTVTATAAGAGSAGFALTNTEVPSLTVTTTADVVDATDGLTSLREAVAFANRHPGPDTIVLDPSAFGSRPRMITLQGGPLTVTDVATTTIAGPGARRLAISGAGRSRVFDVRGGSLALSGLTVTGGRADNGGGIRNDGGRLSLTGIVLRGNSVRIRGGGLFNDGWAALLDVTFRGNKARAGSGLFNTRAATFTWRRSPLGGRG